MNPLKPEIWKSGLRYDDYRSGVRHNAEGFDAVDAASQLRPSDRDWLRLLPPLHVVAVAADWCPDVWQTLPQWARAVETLPGWELRVFDRDRYPELMQQFTWNTGAERVPVYAFYHQTRLQVWWSARSGEAERALQAQLDGRKYGELGEAEREELDGWFRERYEARFREANFREILSLLGAFFHLEPPRPPNG